MQWGAKNKHVVKLIENVKMNGFTGNFFGETLRVNGKLEGNGVIVTESEILLGSFADDEFLSSRKYININRDTHKFAVNWGSIQSRPNGQSYNFGVQYQPSGIIQSGLFIGEV